MADKTFLVVLYNKTLFESETINSIISWGPSEYDKISELIIWNNSVLSLEEKNKRDLNLCLSKTKIHYCEDGLNHPLSEIYNTVIRNLPLSHTLVILDHDSVLPVDYLIRLEEALSKYPDVNLFLPQIYYDSQLVSPAKFYFFYGIYLKKIESGIIKSKFVTAINSGMAIRGHYLKLEYPGYNERIKFYGTDNDFMYRYSKQNSQIVILDVKIKHTLNFYHNTEIDNIIWRYRDISNGILQQMKTINLIVYVLSYIYVNIYALRLSFKYRTLRFFNHDKR